VLKSRQNWFKQEAKYYCLRSTNSLILFRIRKNCLISGRSLLMYQFTKRVITLTNNYRVISLLSTSYNMLSNILLSRLGPYIDEIIGDHQCGFRRNRSTTYQIFCIRQILEKKWKYNETVRQLFIDFKKAYDSVRREVLYNILIEFGVSMKVVRKKTYLNKICSKVDRLCGLVVRVLGYYPEARVRFPALPEKKKSSGSGTGSTRPREYNWGATW
jgi:hypothetical protein